MLSAIHLGEDDLVSIEDTVMSGTDIETLLESAEDLDLRHLATRLRSIDTPDLRRLLRSNSAKVAFLAAGVILERKASRAIHR